MSNEMTGLIHLFWDIACFRKGPQDVPYSVTLFYLVAMVNVITSASLLLKQYSLPISFLESFCLLLILLLFVYSAVNLRDVKKRFLQTATALLGVGAMASLLVVPFFYSALSYLPTDGAAETQVAPILLFPFLMILGLNVWLFIVMANIFRHALNLTILGGLLITLALNGLRFLISYYLFGIS